MLNGPNCNKVLKPETLQAMMEFLPEDLRKYVIALRALDKMKKAVFSTNPLDWTVGANWEFKWKSSNQIYKATPSTLHFKGKKLETNSTRKLQHVLDTINPN